MEEHDAGQEGAHATIEIDAGIREWHKKCPCCFGEAYPDVKRVLDEERRERRRAAQA